MQDSLRQRIKKTAGGVECVKHAVIASNATANTKSLGNDLLDKLKEPDFTNKHTHVVCEDPCLEYHFGQYISKWFKI